MKKSLLFVLTLPLLLASCTAKSVSNNPFSTTPQNTPQTGEDQTQQGGTQTGGNTEHGTEGSGTETTTGGGTETGGGQTTGGGSSETGGGQTTGGGTETASTTVTKAMCDCGFDNAKDVTEFNLANDLKVTLSKGTNTQNAPKYYASDSTLRIYGGNTITFAANSNITKIKLQISTDSGDNGISPSTGSISSDRTTWTGASKSVSLTVLEKSGKISITSISVTYGGTGETTGGGTTGGGGGTETGGGTTGGGTTGGDIQAGNGNTSHSFTSPWEGIQKDIVYQMFKGNLPHYTDFNKYALGDVDGSTIPYFNPYEESNWSKEAQKDYDLALKEMGYKLVSTEPYVDEDGYEDPSTIVNYYEKASFKVQTSHYQVGKLWYFDVYAFNDYVEADPCFTPKSELDRSKITLKSGYQSMNFEGGGYKYSSPAATKYSDYGIQIQANSKITITGDLHDMNILFIKNAFSCVVYAGTSTSNLSPVYNNACNYKFPSGTKVVEIRTLDKECIFENICVD